jgi:hypothetical protein
VYHRDSGTAALVDERRTGAGDKAELRLSPATSVETRRGILLLDADSGALGFA